MLCTHCLGAGDRSAARRRLAPSNRPLTCDGCGAVVLMAVGVLVGVDDDILASLARFGLANMGRPLLEPRLPSA